MAVTTPRRRSPKNPEGRMPLREHLRELRTRLVKAASAVLLGAVVGWFLYDDLVAKLTEPLRKVGLHEKVQASLTMTQVSAPFNLKIKISVYLGLALASPVWLYQLWAFIVPGLTKREKRYAIAFVAAAVPLFLSGLGVAWLVLPNAISFFGTFLPKGSAYLINADDYFHFVTQVFLVFGVAFVVPLLLVALNLVGVLPARTLAKGWRIAVFLTFLFAGIASPSPDAGSMLALGFPMVGLYLLALGVASLHDRRRRDAAAGFGDLSADEASPIDLTPRPVDEPTPFDDL